MTSLKEVAISEAIDSKLVDIHRCVVESPNPSLTRAVLFSSLNNQMYLNHGSETLEVEKKEFLGVVSDLEGRGIIQVKKEGFGETGEYDCIEPDELVGEYFRSELPYGPHKLIKREGLDVGQVRKIMESVDDLVSWDYRNTFHFDDLTKLRELRDSAHEALEEIRGQEAEFWYTELDIPRQYKDFRSFVGEKDPTKIDGYDTQTFYLRAEFDSLDEAFETGFDSVKGLPLAKKEYGNLKTLPPVVDVYEEEKDNYKFTLDNICYKAHWGMFDKIPLAYRKEAEEIMPVLQTRVEAVLS